MTTDPNACMLYRKGFRKIPRGMLTEHKTQQLLMEIIKNKKMVYYTKEQLQHMCTSNSNHNVLSFATKN